jgi:hypothetical protein
LAIDLSPRKREPSYSGLLGHDHTAGSILPQRCIKLATERCVEALKNVLAQMDGEGSLRGRGLTMHGAGTTALLATTAQAREQAQMLKHLLYCNMFAQAVEVDVGPRGKSALGRWLDGRRRRLYGGGSRGDHFFGGQVPFVAHGVLVGRGCGIGVGS